MVEISGLSTARYSFMMWLDYDTSPRVRRSKKNLFLLFWMQVNTRQGFEMCVMYLDTPTSFPCPLFYLISFILGALRLQLSCPIQADFAVQSSALSSPFLTPLSPDSSPTHNPNLQLLWSPHPHLVLPPNFHSLGEAVLGWIREKEV